MTWPTPEEIEAAFLKLLEDNPTGTMIAIQALDELGEIINPLPLQKP